MLKTEFPKDCSVSPEKFKEYDAVIRDSIFRVNMARALFEARDEEFSELAKKLGKSTYTSFLELVEDAVMLEQVMCVSKLWERTNASRSIPKFVDEFDWDCLQSQIAGTRWESERCKAIQRLNEITDGFMFSDGWRSLRVTRAEGYAHSLLEANERMKMAAPYGADKDEINRAHDLAIEVWNCVDMACFSIGARYPNRNQLKKLAKKFYQSQPDLRIKSE